MIFEINLTLTVKGRVYLRVSCRLNTFEFTSILLNSCKFFDVNSKIRLILTPKTLTKRNPLHIADNTMSKWNVHIRYIFGYNVSSPFTSFILDIVRLQTEINVTTMTCMYTYTCTPIFWPTTRWYFFPPSSQPCNLLWWHHDLKVKSFDSSI